MNSFKITLCAIVLCFASIFQIHSTTVGTGGTYTTLKAAFDAINARTLTGDVVLEIVGNTSEPNLSAVLNDSAVGLANYRSVKIYPTGAARTISGSFAGAMLNINGRNVTIDGSIGGTGSDKSLTITNTNNTGTTGIFTITLGTATHGVMVKNCVLKGSATHATNSAVISLLNVSTTVSSYNNTITNNDITKNGSAAPSIGVLVSGTPTKPITNCVISNNNIYDFTSSGVYFPANKEATNNIYSGNKIYQTGSVTGTIIGFNMLNKGTSEQFLRNTISDIASTSASTTIKGFYFSNYASVTLANNVINLSSSNVNTTIYGIQDNSTAASVSNEINVYFNTINISGTNGSSYCYTKAARPKATLRNNIFVNQRTGTSYVFAFTSTIMTELVMDHNVLNNSSISYIAYIGGLSKSFEQLLSITGGDTDTHNELPFFLSPTNLHIQTGVVSPVSGGGIPISSFTTDFDGATRDDRFPDVGAYEYIADYFEFRGNTSPELDNNWETASNWCSHGIPTASDSVVINDHKIVNITSSPSSPAVCKDLIILSGTTLYINPGKALSVNGILTNSGYITMQADSLNNSSLITNSAVKAKVERSMEHAKWELIASPIVDQDLSAFANSSDNDVASSQDGVYRGFRDYNTSLNTWNDFFTDVTIPSYGNLNQGQGYSLLRTGTTLTTTSPTKISFFGNETIIGTINVDPLTVPVTRFGANGWNCLGNPYTAPIALNENAQSTNNFLTVNADSLDPSFVAVYAWTDTSTVAYRIINNADPACYMPVATGFFVKAKVSPVSVSFDPNMRVHQSDVDFRAAVNNWYSLDLRATTKSGNLSTSIKMNSRMTDGLDKSYDGGLMRMSNSYALYTKLINDNGVDFAVQCFTDTFNVAKVVPVGFDFKVGGTVTFSANNLNLPEGVICSLEDKVAKVNTDLSTAGSIYNIDLPASTSGVGRFYLHFIQTVSTGIKDPIENIGVSVDKLNGEINVYGLNLGHSTASIYDVNGVVRKTFNLFDTSLNTLSVLGLNKGIYILRISNSKKGIVRKFSL